METFEKLLFGALSTVMGLSFYFMILQGGIFPTSSTLIEEHKLIMAERNVGDVPLLMKCESLQNENPALKNDLFLLNQKYELCQETKNSLWGNLNLMLIGLAGFFGLIFGALGCKIWLDYSMTKRITKYEIEKIKAISKRANEARK